jgi:hypothetical protein
VAKRSRSESAHHRRKRRASPAAPAETGAENRLFVPLLILTMIVVIVFLFRDFVFSNRMLYGSDVLSSAYQFRLFARTWLLEHHRWPGWNPYIFGGLPYADAMHSDIFYPTWILRLFMPVARTNGYVFCIHILLSGIATFAFMRSLGVGRIGASISSLAYMFAASQVSFVFDGHDGRFIVTSMLPVTLFFLHRGLTGRGGWNFVLGGGAVGLALLSPQVQMSYYLGMAASLFLLAGLWRGWRTSRDPRQLVRYLALFGVMAAVGLCLAAVQFLPAYSYLEHSPRGAGGRGYEFATSWSMPPEETVNLLAPSFSGLLDAYWGRNFFKHHSEYLGVIPLILAAAGIALARRRAYVSFFIGLSVFSLFMAFGGHTPLYKVAYYLIPRIKQFRAPALIFYLFSFSIAVLAGFGLEALSSEARTRARRFVRNLVIVVGVLAVCLLIFAAGREGMSRWLADMVRPYLAARYSPQVIDFKLENLAGNFSAFLISFLRSLVMAGLAAGVIWMLIQRKLIAVAALSLLGALLLFDLVSIDSRFVRTVDPAARFYAKDEIVEYLSLDEGIFRVYPYDYRPNDDYLMLFDIQNVGGHHGNQLRKYQEFLGGGETVMFYAPNLQYKNFLDLLNVKYIIASKQIPAPGLPMVYSGSAYNIYLNETALPRAFLVSDFRVVPEGEVLPILRRTDFDPGAMALVDEAPGFAPSAHDSTAGEVRIVCYMPDRVEVEASTSQPSLLVLSDNYYPMWKATVDGSPTKIYRAYSTFRAVPLEGGSHTVVFTYDSIYLKIGFVLSSAASLLLVAACCVILFQWQRRRRA